jgi:hypothetical protein
MQATKQATAPKWVVKTNATIQTLKGKKDKSSFDWVRLTNATDKLENKSLSNVFKKVKELTESQKAGILGKSKFPAFKDFKNVAKEGKNLFSFYDGLMMLRKFNKVETIKTKVRRQNASQLKKVG